MKGSKTKRVLLSILAVVLAVAGVYLLFPGTREFIGYAIAFIVALAIIELFVFLFFFLLDHLKRCCEGRPSRIEERKQQEELEQKLQEGKQQAEQTRKEWEEQAQKKQEELQQMLQPYRKQKEELAQKLQEGKQQEELARKQQEEQERKQRAEQARREREEKARKEREEEERKNRKEEQRIQEKLKKAWEEHQQEVRAQIEQEREDLQGKQLDAEVQEVLFHRVSSELQELFDAVSHRLEQELALGEQILDAFYASPQSRDIHATIGRHLMDAREGNDLALEVGMTCLRQSEKGYLEEVYTSPRPIYRAEDLFSWSYLKRYLAGSGLSEEQMHALETTADKMRASIHDLVWSLPGAGSYNALRKHWKPVHVLSGKYGDYGTLLCYDEEFKILFSMYPDDNYYHWGNYIINPICFSKEDAERVTGKKLPGGTERPPCFQGYYENDEGVAISARIKPFQQE